MSNFLALLVIVLSSTSAEPVLKQIHVITRHGARYPVQKSSATLVEHTQGSLTLIGQRQLYDLGLWLREQYELTGIFKLYMPSNFRLESSEFERTIVSANSLALGLFDEASRNPFVQNLLPAVPPVYTRERKNDVTIRAYDKCSTFQKRLTELYASPEWKGIEVQNTALLTRLGEVPSFQTYADDSGKVPLTEVYNIYDAVHVAKTECQGEEETKSCLDLPDPSVKDVLSASEWGKLQRVSHKAELLKYGSETAGRIVGGNLLLQMLNRMQESSPSKVFEKFYLYSAHYPTILGVFSALNMTPIESQAIPDYATSLIFELYEDTVTRERSFQVIYKAGDDVNISEVLVGACSSKFPCPLASLASFLSGMSLEGWCDECGNDSADVCLQTTLQSGYSCSTRPSLPLLCFGVLIGLGASVAVSAFLLWCRHNMCWRRTESPQSPHKSELTDSTESTATMA